MTENTEETDGKPRKEGIIDKIFHNLPPLPLGDYEATITGAVHFLKRTHVRWQIRKDASSANKPDQPKQGNMEK